MARGEPIEVPGWVLGAMAGGFALFGALTLGTAVVVTMVADGTVVGPGEDYNRAVAEAFLREVQAGTAPTAPVLDGAIDPAVSAAVTRSQGWAETDVHGAYFDATHGTTCLDYDLHTSEGDVAVVLRIDGDRGPATVTHLQMASRCECRRSGKIRCG